MPTAIEYGLMTTQWHTQNGAGGGPPAQNVWPAQNGAGSGPPHATVIQPDVPPATPADEWLLTGPLAAIVLVAAIVAAVRRRART